MASAVTTTTITTVIREDGVNTRFNPVRVGIDKDGDIFLARENDGPGFFYMTKDVAKAVAEALVRLADGQS